MNRNATNRAVVANQVSTSAYVPPFELTKGQGAPVAANGGRSYLAFDRNGDAGTTAATEDALRMISEGSGQAVIDLIDNTPPGPIETPWGLGFRTRAECLEYIRANGIVAPEGGIAVPMYYTIHEAPSYSIVSSNALWSDPARQVEANALRQEEIDIGRRCLYFPKVLRDARRIGEYYPGLAPNSAECMDKLGVALAHCESKCTNFYDAHEVERVFYPEMEKLLLEFFPGATDALVYNHDVFDKDYTGDRTEDQANKNPGVQANYAYLVHNDLNDNSGRVRCRELLTKNLRNFGREQRYTEAEADAKMARRFISINLANRCPPFARIRSCFVRGRRSPTRRTSPTTGCMTIALVRRHALRIDRITSGTGFRSSSPPRSRC